MAILTVSRQFGCGSTEVLQEIVSSLHYVLVDKRMLLKDIRERGATWENWAKEFDESAPDFWERHDRSFRGFGAMLQHVYLKYALQDNVILKGRGAGFLMKGIPHAFRTRFVASLENRLERITLRDSLDDETARFLIEKTDQERAGFVDALYDKDVTDPGYYDAVFDTGRQSVEEMADAIKQVLIERSALKTPEAQDLISRRATSAKIKAKLITDSKLYVPVLDVDCTENELVIKGIVRNPDQFRRIVEAARELAGEWPVKVELRYRI